MWCGLKRLRGHHVGGHGADRQIRGLIASLPCDGWPRGPDGWGWQSPEGELSKHLEDTAYVLCVILASVLLHTLGGVSIPG